MAGTVQKDVAVGLDIGTSGIYVAVLKNGYGAKQELLGLGYSPSVGVEKGRIVNPEEAATAVKKAVADARAAAGVAFTSVYVNIDGPELAAGPGNVKRAIARRQVIARRHLQELYRHLCETVLPAEWLVVQLVNNSFYIDGKHVDRPLGCRGRELGMEAVVLAVPERQMEQTLLCLRNADLKIAQTVAGPLAIAQTVLAGVERQLGVVCVDIGAGITKATFINHGILYRLNVFPVGGGHITADLAVGLHTSLKAAERVKIDYGLGSIAGHVNVPNLSGTDCNVISGELVHRIIRSRSEEILEFVKQFIKNLKLEASLPGGIVLTGGGALLCELPELARDYLKIPVRRGYNVLLEGKASEDAYRYTTAVGLALWGTEHGQANCEAMRMAEGGFVGRFKSWLR
ncbi:cell division protein FtsA [Desulfoscipio sp. XC116]|uniref:cell division protein FtsA n=1 Tax=Desulfoscipio sp. XC116 TaxID=3144975 RepID=UPI00325BC4C2